MSIPRTVAQAFMLVFASVIASEPAWAQPEPIAQRENPEDDPIFQRVFPPELVMGHAEEIGLTSDQRARVIAEVERLQADARGIGPRAEQARAQMVTALSAERVDEARVLEALDRVLSVERDVKRLHIATLVRIRNVLTPQQRTRLSELR
jgi:Spy/CpxP family protein refolding chaperone